MTDTFNTIVDDVFDTIDDTKPIIDATVDKDVTDKVPGEGVIKDEDVFYSEGARGELPKVKSDFIISADRARDMASALKAQSAIKDRGTISTEDISSINAAIPGLINDDNPLEQYTKVASKTHVAEGLASISNLLEQQYDELRIAIKELCSKYIALNSQTADNIQSKFWKVLTDLNQTQAKLLVKCGCSDLDQISYIFNDHTQFGQWLLSSAYEWCSSDNVTKDNNFTAPMRLDPDRPQDKIIHQLVQYHGRYCVIGSRGISFGDELAEYSNSQVESFSSPVYKDLLEYLIGYGAKTTVNAARNSYIKNLGDIQTLGESIKDVEDSNVPLAVKIKEITDITTKVNELVAFNSTLVMILGSVFKKHNDYQVMLDALLAANQ